MLCKRVQDAVFVVIAIHFFLFPNSGRTLGVKRKQGSLGDQQIRETEQGEKLRGVLSQAAIARLLQSENVFDDVKRMLDFGPDAGLGLLDPLIDPPISVCGSALRLPGRIATCHVTADARFSSRFSTPW